MLHSKVIKSIAAVMLVMGIFTACKKDAFSEKDAIAAQTTLLQTKFSYDLAIKQIDLQIQRSGDSAKIVIQNLVNSGATALEILKQQNILAQILQNQNNTLAQLRYADSLSRNTAVISDQLSRQRALWNDSVEKAKANSIIALSLQKNYSLTFTDFNTGLPVTGATVSVLPFASSTAVTAKTNTQGVANFTGLVIDPGAFFSISATGYGTVLLRENSLTSSSATATVGSSSTTYTLTTRFNASATTMYNLANTRNTIKGSVLGDIDLTNGDLTEAISGQLITFTSSITTSNGITTIYQFSALSDANGNYSVSVPDGTYTPIYPSTVRVQQKLFVNSFTDEDATKSLPRIDSVGTTLQAVGGTVLSSGSGQGFYLTFPSDTINPTRTVFAAASSGLNTGFTPSNFTGQFGGSFANRNTSPKTDSLFNFNFQTSSNTFFNNLVVNSNNDNSVVYSRTALYSPAKPTAILPVTLVSLLPGWIVSAPLLDAQVNGNTGKINGIQLRGTYSTGAVAGSGGVFNNAVMFTTAGRPIYTNLSGLYGPYVGSLATAIAPANSTNSFTLTSGNSFYLPIEYRNAVARDRTPR